MVSVSLQRNRFMLVHAAVARTLTSVQYYCHIYADALLKKNICADARGQLAGSFSCKTLTDSLNPHWQLSETNQQPPESHCRRTMVAT